VRIRAKSDEEPLLNLTPMIDVVFQLLVFFMVATTFLDPEKEIDIELPEASSGQAGEADDSELIINVFADGRIVLSGQVLEVEQLLDELRAAARADPDRPVTIRGDRLVYHERIVSVMDACEQAGMLNLGISITEGT